MDWFHATLIIVGASRGEHDRLQPDLFMRPTRTRFQASGFLFLLAAVTYLDRICISTLAPDISRDLGLSKLQMSFVFSAFAVAYAGFEIISAWWGEKIGARRVLTRIVLWWSVFTMATAARMELHQHAGDPIPFRRGRGGRVAQCGAGLLALDSAARARTRAGFLLRGGAPVGWTHAAAGGLADDAAAVARRLCGMRLLRRDLGCGVVSAGFATNRASIPR